MMVTFWPTISSKSMSVFSLYSRSSQTKGRLSSSVMSTDCSSMSSASKGAGRPMVRLRAAWDHLAIGHHPSGITGLAVLRAPAQGGQGLCAGRLGGLGALEQIQEELDDPLAETALVRLHLREHGPHGRAVALVGVRREALELRVPQDGETDADQLVLDLRSEERRVGKEERSRGSASHYMRK